MNDFERIVFSVSDRFRAFHEWFEKLGDDLENPEPTSVVFSKEQLLTELKLREEEVEHAKQSTDRMNRIPESTSYQNSLILGANSPIVSPRQSKILNEKTLKEETTLSRTYANIAEKDKKHGSPIVVPTSIEPSTNCTRSV